MLLADHLNRSPVAAWSRITVASVVVLFGLTFLITPASALTHVYTDGEMQVRWQIRVPESGDQKDAEDEAFCDFGRYDIDEPMPQVIVTRVSTEAVVKNIQACERFVKEKDSHKKEHRSIFRQRRNTNPSVYPGTNWCGIQNTATSFFDLGVLRREDACCRQQHHCPNILHHGQSRGGVQNTSGFPILSCSCDIRFRQCMRQINSDAANAIGDLFLNRLGNGCFRQDANGNLQLYDSPRY